MNQNGHVADKIKHTAADRGQQHGKNPSHDPTRRQMFVRRWAGRVCGFARKKLARKKKDG